MSSFEIARLFLGKRVTVVVDRPMGSYHPLHGFYYPVNYGSLPGVTAPDGDDLDAYVLGVDHPIDQFNGLCVAIVHRLDDDDDKLVVVPEGLELDDAAVLSQTAFQEQFFTCEVRRI